MAATLRAWLTDAGFDWQRGVLIVQNWNAGSLPGKAPCVVHWDDPRLDDRFGTGLGGVECPRFIAKDKAAVYFAGQYEGSTWCERVFLDINCYLQAGIVAPLVGG